MSQLNMCYECGALTCGIDKCTSTCKCDSLPAAESLLEDSHFRAQFCLHSHAEKCEGCFLKAKSQVTFLKDASGRYLHVSNSFQKYFGIPASRLINNSPYECFPYEVARELAEGDCLVLRSGKSDTRVIQWRHPESNKKSLWMVKKVLLREGVVMGMAFDITEYVLSCKADNAQAMDDAHTSILAASLGAMA